MSDIAVTWAKAQVCLNKAGKPDRSAKQVLVHMASYADAAGEAWVLVDVLKMEMDVEYRTVERGRKALVDAGLLIKTDKTHLHSGKLIPVYRLPLETGHASTVRRRMAERAAASPVTSDAPSGPLPPSRVTPQAVADDGARGVTGDAQIGKGNTQGFKPSTRACAKAIRLWASKAPERVSPPLVDAAWAAVLDRTDGLTPERLEAAVGQAVKHDPDFGRGRAMNLNRWLDENRFVPWLTDDADEPGLSVRSGWQGPADVRAAVVVAMGESAAAAYVDPSGWDGDGRTIRVRTLIARERLLANAGVDLKRLGVKVEREVRRGA